MLFKISPLHLFFLLSFLHQEIILPGFCLLLHTSSVFFLSSCAARSPFAVIIPFCIPIPVFQGHLFHLSCLHLIPCRQVSSPVLFPLLFQALLQLQLCFGSSSASFCSHTSQVLVFPLLLFTEKSRIRKRFIFGISECNSGAGRGGESAPGSSCLRAGQLECGPEQSSMWGLCLAAGVSLGTPGTGMWGRARRNATVMGGIYKRPIARKGP